MREEVKQVPYITRLITELSYKTPFRTNLYQSQNAIRYYDLSLSRVTRYTFESKVVSNTMYPKLSIYHVDFLPIGGATSRKDRNLSLYELPMLLAVNAYKAIYPFLLFVDGKAIPWSKITIVRDRQDTFIAIDQEIDYLSSIQCIIFPLGIRYGEDDLIDPSLPGLYFDSDGYLCTSNLTDVSIRIEIPLKTKHVIKKEILNEGINTINFWPRGYNEIGVIDDSNKILFKKDENENLFLADPTEMIDVDHIGLGVYQTKNATEGDLLLLTYDTQHNPNVTHLDPLDDSEKEEFIKDFYNLVSTNSDIGDHPLKDILSFQNNPELSAAENVANHLKTILEFDYGCIKDLFIKSSRVFSKEFTGKEINEWKNENNKLIFSRIRSNNTLSYDYVIVFKNGNLYEYYYRIKYVNSQIELPIIDVEDNDKFTFVYFTKAMNDVLDINIPDKNKEFEISQRFTKDMELYYDKDFIEPMTYEYYFDKQRTSFKVPINNIEEIKPHTYTFDLDGDLYYNKDLKLVSKRQFRYYHSHGNCNISHVNLGEQFKYCHNPNRYLVFINGVKLNRDNYALCFPGNTNPFSAVLIYFAAILEPEDSVDIFYLPEELYYKEADDLNLSGEVKIEDNYEIPYLSKHLQLFFVNGLLISKDNIKDINKNRIKIKQSSSIHNVVVIDTLDKIELIGTLLSTILTHSYIFSGYKYGEDLDIKELIDIMVTYIDKEDRWSKYVVSLFVRILDYMTKTFNSNLNELEKNPLNPDSTEEELEDAKDIWDNIELPDDMIDSEIVDELKEMTVFDKIFGKSNIEDLEDLRNDFDELKGAIYDMLFEQYIMPYNISTNQEFVFDYDNTSIDMEEYEEGKLRQLTFTDSSLYDKMYHYRMRKLTQEEFNKDIAAGDVPWKEGE